MLAVSPGDDFDKDESPAYKAIIRKALGNLIASTNEWRSTWNFRGFGLDDTDAATLAKGLDGNTIITKIDMTSNHFTEVGLQELAKMMENNSTITRMYLRCAFLAVGVEHTTHIHTHTRTHAHTWAQWGLRFSA